MHLGREQRAVEGDRDLAHERLEQPLLLRRVEGARLGGTHPHDADDPARGGERLESHLRAGEVVGAGAGGGAVLERPLRDRMVARVHVERRQLARALLEPPGRIGKEDHDPTAEDLEQVTQSRLQEGRNIGRGRELAGQREQRGAAALLGA